MKKQNFAVITVSQKDLDHHFSTSGKAFYIDYESGEWQYHENPHVWVPKSICRFSETNDVGNLTVAIPMWFLTKNQLDYHRLENFTDVIYQ